MSMYYTYNLCLVIPQLDFKIPVTFVGTKLLNLNQRVDDSRDHFLTVRWTNHTVQMDLADKTCSNEISSASRHNCFRQIMIHDSTHHYINTNGPLQVGGVSFGADRFQDLSSALGLDR